MVSFLYFAYGSNMFTQRLQARCKSAHARGVARAERFGISFGKKSKDGSGKATLLTAELQAAFAYGVVFNIDKIDLRELDRYEGVGSGYVRVADFTVQTEPDGARLAAMTYLATYSAVDPHLMPYQWYLDLVVAGARQHKLPGEYIRDLVATKSLIDPQPKRRSRLEALMLLDRWSTA